ncbi:Glycosyltransferase, GT2 family [Flavobacterium glycines]|uniref:Glycosyl transferase family 2 n=1 Tax=Flavobacterium glycines TaxID=551990 RepID=A0A1B9DH69_9FLAO|nr:glycosyltransferase [Flavobacterium glycines]OCB69041.1 glycosyl transferase family 2 [Flavobacterium glycines]GEL12411.1 glycosyl transferase family 2 [Flavobacterium glycines]SDJ52376.1 Glycosyltransferase, GT2 family [Flavobacterium glycines]
MKFTLIVCTYMRPEPLLRLLQSVQGQTLYPDEIIIIDGSLNQETEALLKRNPFQNLSYFLVSEENRGLTRQRNFGISKVADTSEIVCFLDDDTVLEPDYFKELIKTFEQENIIGTGGVAVNENKWQLIDKNKKYNKKHYYLFEKFVYKEGQRNVIRNYLGLQSNLGPGKMPAFSHSRTCGFPLTDKIYEVDLLIGMAMAFRKSIFENIQFSKYFEDYGLYEDADFSLRALAFGKNVINTKVKLYHFHEASGRPNQFQYGKMVVKNGFYVWRVKNPNPVFKDKFKWHSITLLLTLIRFSNIFTTTKRKEAFTEALGRIVAWFQLLN